MALPIETEPYDNLRARFQLALEKVWPIYMHPRMQDRPGLHRENVFDCVDGFRIIVSRGEIPDSPNVGILETSISFFQVPTHFATLRMHSSLPSSRYTTATDAQTDALRAVCRISGEDFDSIPKPREGISHGGVIHYTWPMEKVGGKWAIR